MAALLLLLLLAPLLVLVVLLIRAGSPGPALFRQERTGLGNRPFRIYKFRTMYSDRGDPTGVAQTVAGDARVTPIGRVLRRTNLDELPQLINVLKGDMSLVGPRPHVPGMLAGGVPFEDLVPDYPLRHAMRPGVTGLAQANGLRGPTTDAAKARARIAHDLRYIETFSLSGDVAILAKTVWREFASGS